MLVRRDHRPEDDRPLTAGVFTLEEANALVPEVARRMARLAPVARRVADAADDRRSRARSNGHGARVPGAADLRAGLAWFEERGIQVKGFAPPLVDFPRADGLLLCWTDGEDRITHVHAPEDGFAGRRPVEDLP